jgi:sigma-E factor negative regulatory protein RseA
MSQQIREQLSALMDGELAGDETAFLLRRMGHEQELGRCWSSYHVCRQVLRRQELSALRPDFAGAIMVRLDGEPALRTGRSGRWIRWASGGAIAASVAALALVFGGPQGGSVGAPGVEPLTAKVGTGAATSPGAIQATDEFRPPLLSPALDVQPASASSAGFSAPGTPLDPRLQSYLVRHYDAAGNAGQSAVIPYVLLIVPSQQQAASPVVEKPTELR